MPSTPTPRDISRLIEAIEHQLRQTPPRSLQVGHAREVLLALRAMQAQQDELWRLREIKRMYAVLVEDFNAARKAPGRQGNAEGNYRCRLWLCWHPFQDAGQR